MCTSIFNLFVVSVFWSLVTDIFRPGQGKRLFGVVAVGGTIGAVFGSTITTSTFLYFQQVDIVARVFKDDAVGRTRVFGQLDLAVNVLTLLAQLFLTGRVMKWFGVSFALAFLPGIKMTGFGIMSIAPVLAVLVVFQVVRRAGNFAIQRPGREAWHNSAWMSDVGSH